MAKHDELISTLINIRWGAFYTFLRGDLNKNLSFDMTNFLKIFLKYENRVVQWSITKNQVVQLHHLHSPNDAPV